MTTQSDVVLAMDRDSVRSYDPDRRMHISLCNISKATVNPYRGSEIPGAAALGLDENRIYWLLRDPKELERAAPTFNNLPLLSEHTHVTAEDHRPDLVAGSTGSHCVYEHPFLRNSLSVWKGESIKGIEEDEQRQLSASYRYRADLTPGEYEGVSYDGVMRDIHGNHVALVPVGRAGPDVVVGDAALDVKIEDRSRPKPRGKFYTNRKFKRVALDATFQSAQHPRIGGKFAPTGPDPDEGGNNTRRRTATATRSSRRDNRGSRGVESGTKAKLAARPSTGGSKQMADGNKVMTLMVRGALQAYLAPKLAQDAQIDVDSLIKGVTVENWGSKQEAIKTGLATMTKNKLAADADLEDVGEVLEQIAQNKEEIAAIVADDPNGNPNPNPPGPAMDEATRVRVREFLAGRGVAEDDLEAVISVMKDPATAEDKFKKGTRQAQPTVSKAAMDAAIEEAKGAARTEGAAQAMKDFAAIRDAERIVRPIIGDIAVAQDSATKVFKLALDHHKIDLTGVHESAYPALVKMLPTAEAASQPSPQVKIAADKAIDDGLAQRFPGIGAQLKKR